MASFNTPAYRIGYLNALKQQQKNEARNLEANIVFQETGKLMGTLEDPITIQAGNVEQMRALIKQYLANQIVASDIDQCIAPLPGKMVEWLYENLSTVKQIITKTFGGVPVNCVQFKTLVGNLASGSQGDAAEIDKEAEAEQAAFTMDGASGDFAPVPTVGSQLPSRKAAEGGIIGRGAVRGKGVTSGNAALIMPGAKRAFRFREFGKYVIDLEKLRDNELAVKYKNGKRVARIDAKIMGGQLADVVKKVAEGEKLSRADLSKLTSDEKAYLDHVRKESQVQGLDELNCSIKSERNRERHEFEVMKGQILAGNDNSQLVKKFKTMLVRLSNNKQLPEKEAKSLLMDLAAMGV